VSGKPALPHLVLNVPAIARRPESEVAQYLGMPDPGTPSVTPGNTKRSYRNGKVEVVFAEGEARWIKLYTTQELPFGAEALAKLGLPPRRPTYDNSPHVISWHNIPHLKEVSLYGGGAHGTASSVLICVQTTNPSGTRGARPRRFSFPRIHLPF
jgi:hypothetical protein